MKFKLYKRSKSNSPNLQNLQGTKAMPLSDATAQAGTHGDRSNTLTQKNTQLSFVSAISELKLTDFIQCSVFGNMTPIIINPQSEYTQEQAQEVATAWLKLLSQYYDARGDRKADNQRKIQSSYKELELRKSIIEMLSESLRLIYNPIIVEKLQFYYPMFEFTEQSYLQDLDIMKNMEVPNNLQFSELKKIIEGQQSDDKKPEQKAIYDYVAAYNRAFKTEFSVNKLFTLEYAYMCKDYDNYCDELRRQNKSNG